jgi:hypothetical protein
MPAEKPSFPDFGADLDENGDFLAESEGEEGVFDQKSSDARVAEFQTDLEVDAKYQHGHADTSEVVKNIGEYIIPECQATVKKFWSLGIDTFMCSNQDDQDLYVLVDGLSPENLQIMQNKASTGGNYFFDSFRNTYGVRVEGNDQNSAAELEQLAAVFKMQDVSADYYQTPAEFLKQAKTVDGGYLFDSAGTLIRQENPALAGLSFTEALRREGAEALFIPEEQRVYRDQLYLDWHRRYLEFLAKQQ